MVAVSRLICRRIGEMIIRFFPRKIEFRFDLAPYEIERFFGYFCINRQKYPSGADEAVVLRVERAREMTLGKVGERKRKNREARLFTCSPSVGKPTAPSQEGAKKSCAV